MKITVFQEESTSVFIPNDGLAREAVEVIPSVPTAREAVDIMPSVQTASQVVNPAIMEKISYLSKPFQKQVYKPLRFIVEGTTVKGEIQKVEDGTLWIEADDSITEVEIAKIEDVLWRGQSFDTKA